jgi:hypothetical protein
MENKTRRLERLIVLSTTNMSMSITELNEGKKSFILFHIFFILFSVIIEACKIDDEMLTNGGSIDDK